MQAKSEISGYAVFFKPIYIKKLLLFLICRLALFHRLNLRFNIEFIFCLLLTKSHGGVFFFFFVWPTAHYWERVVIFRCVMHFLLTKMCFIKSWRAYIIFRFRSGSSKIIRMYTLLLKISPLSGFFRLFQNNKKRDFTIILYLWKRLRLIAYTKGFIGLHKIIH